jgi:hypothetical protein
VTPSTIHLLQLAAGLLLLVARAHAAGGHHSVDDAALLEPGQCQVEVWTDRADQHARSLLHAGTACRVGPVELGVNGERTRLGSVGAVVSAGPQVKWAQPLTPSLRVGAVLAATWQDTSPHFAGSSLVFPVTWQAHDTLQLHVNLGRDFLHGAADLSRAGAALEWAPLPAWSFVAERFREGGGNFLRAGTRYAVNPNVSLDLSRARGLGGSAPAWWTLGVNYVFDR